MSERAYAVVLEPGKSSWSAYAPDAPGRAVTGRDRDAVVRRARELLGLWLADLAEDGEPEPAPTPAEAVAIDGPESEHEVVRLEPLRVNPVSLELERLLRRRGISQRELARRMGMAQSSVNRLLDPWYFGHSLESLRKVAAALDASVEVRLPDAPARAA